MNKPINLDFKIALALSTKINYEISFVLKDLNLKSSFLGIKRKDIHYRFNNELDIILCNNLWFILYDELEKDLNKKNQSI